MFKLRKIFYGYLIIIASLFIIITSHSVPFSFGIYFTPMVEEFGWTRAATSGAFSLSRIISGVLSIFIGGLNDRIGPRMVVTFCGLSIVVGCLLMSTLNTLTEFYLVYGIVLAIGPSMFVAIASTITKWFVKRRSVMTGIVVSGLGVSTLISAPAADFLIRIYDWRTAYLYMGIIVTILVVFFAQFLRKDPSVLGLSPYGKDNGGSVVTHAIDHAYTLREAVGTNQFWLFFAYSVCFAYCLMTIMVHSVPAMIDSGLSSNNAANILGMGGAITIGSMIGMGRLADRVSNRKTQIAGFVLLTVAFIVFMFSHEEWHFYMFAILFGIAWGGIGVPRSPIVAEMFGTKSHGLIFGVVDNSYTLGGAAGPVITGYIYDISGSYQAAFLLALIVSITGLVLTILINPQKTQTAPDRS